MVLPPLAATARAASLPGWSTAAMPTSTGCDDSTSPERVRPRTVMSILPVGAAPGVWA
jgi:hypothetical protein